MVNLEVFSQVCHIYIAPAGQVILDGLNNELDELGVARDQDRDEEVTLQSV